MSVSLARRNPHLNDAVAHLDQYMIRAKHDPKKAFKLLSKRDHEFIDAELGHCLTDARYYLENYHVIQPIEGQMQTLIFLDSQEIIYNMVLELQAKKIPVKLVILKARQIGSSTLSEGLIFHKTIFNKGCNTLIIAQDPSQADFLFGMSRLALDSLPWWMRPESRYEAKGRYLVFDKKDDIERQFRPGLRSQIIVEASNKMTSAGRGKNFRAAHMSELASWGDGGLLSKSLLPTMQATDELAIMESTAEGRTGFWYEWWRQVESREIAEWFPVFIPYYCVKRYSLPIPKKMTFTLTPEEAAVRQKVLDNENFLISDTALNWVRAKKREFVATTGDEFAFYQEFPCLVGSTRVPTDHGMVPIGRSMEGMRTGGKRITGWYRKGTKPVFTARTKLGYEITGTFDHKVPTLSGECGIGELAGRIVSLSPPEFAQQETAVTWEGVCRSTCTIPMTEDLARLLGYFMGDGSYSRDGGISICCDIRDEDVIADVEALLTHYFGDCHKRVVGSKQGGLELRVGSVAFVKVMSVMGIYKERPPHRKLCVPEEIWTSPKSVVRQFLRGLFEADGFNAYATQRVSLFSKEMDFLREVQILLLGFGITSSRRSRPAVNGQGHPYEARTLDLRSSEARKFNKEIGFISQRKSARSRDVDCLVGRPQSKISFVDTVISVEAAGDEFVYDITVEKDHLFNANGIIVHNCNPHEAFQASGTCAFPKRLLQKLLEKTCHKPLWFGEIDLKISSEGRPNIKFYNPVDQVANTLHRVGKGERVPAARDRGERLRVWEMPEAGEEYYIGGDVAMGDGGDFSVAQVLKIGRGMSPDEQVAEWHGWINPSDFAYVLGGLGYWYNQAEISCELNDVGLLTNNELFRKIEYPNIYRWKHIDKVKNFMTDLFGWYTNSKTRDLVIAKTREALMDGTLVIRSEQTIDEMMAFAREEGSDRYEGRGTNDDLVMAMVICRYCAHESDSGFETSGKSKAAVGPETWYIFDQLNRLRFTCDERDKAEAHVKANAGWSMNKAPAKKNFANTEYSPIHDKPGIRQDLHYNYGIPAEKIEGDLLLHAQMAMGAKGDEETDWRSY